MNEIPNNPSGPILLLNKYSLNIGSYKIVLHVYSVNSDISIYKENCILTVEASPPVAVIQGGFQRYVGLGIDLLLNASGCLDYNSEEPADPTNFEYSWIYDCDTCNGFITAKEKDPVLLIRGTQHMTEMRYLVKLGIRSKWWNETVFAQQLVYIRKETPGIDIVCARNCFPAFREGNLVLMPVCTYHCPKNVTWTWKIYKVPKEDDAIISGSADWQFRFSNTTEQHFIKLSEDDFDHDAGYIATASLNEFKDTAASYKFSTLPKYQFSCLIHPAEGTVLETKFFISCKGETLGSYFWVSVATDDDREQILVYDSSWEYLIFMIPKVGNVYMRFTDYSGVENGIFWNPKSASFNLLEVEKKPETIYDLYYNGTDSVENLLAAQDYAALLDKMTLISKSIASMNVSEFHKVEGVAEALVRDLKKVPMKDAVNVEKGASIMDDLTGVDVIFPPKFSTDFTAFCEQLAEKYRRLVKNQYLSGKTGDMPVHTTVSQLMQCTASGIRPNKLALEQRDVDLEITTVFYIIEEGNVNTEVYDEYKDDTEAAHNIDMYKNVTNSFIGVCLLNGRILLRRLMTSHIKSQDTVKSEKYIILVTRKFGYKIVLAPLEILGVKLAFSKDLVDSEEIYSVIMCATSDDIFWWQDAIEIVSDILIITIKYGKTIISQFHKPFEIKFSLKRKPQIRHPLLISPIRMTQLSRDPEEPGEEQLAIYVIPLEAGYSLAVEFPDIDEDLLLNVVCTTFKLPTLSDFKGDMQMITDEFNYYLNEEVYDYDTFRLLAVMASPLNELRKDEVFEFGMYAYAVTCVKWANKQKRWIPGCRAKFLENMVVICSCETLSTITTSVKNIPIKKWQDYIPLPVDLEEQQCYDMCIAVGLVFLLYSIAICFVVLEKDNVMKAIYFLSDVVRDDRFGYLIIINTSFRLGSGTTSNVMIRLKGLKGSSEPHVLNYPDPLMLLLQRREENWFILATRKNLGPITEVELWIDGVGSDPSWNCSNIAVFDLQHKMWYRFKIKQAFTIYPKPRVYLRSFSIDEKKDRTSIGVIHYIFKKCLPTFQMFNFSLRQTDESLSYIKRLSTMLCTFTSIAIWCIVIDGFPLENPTDSIMKSCTYTINVGNMINGIGGCITTAFYHIPIKYFFITSQVEKPYYPLLQKSRKPVIFSVICWLITIILIIFNISFIIILGVWIPHVKSLILLTEVLIGMIFYIFVVDTIGSSCIGLIHGDMEITHYLQKSLRIVLEDIEKQRMILYRVFGKYLLRPFLEHLYTPLHGTALRILWHTEKIRYEVKELVHDLIMFLIYISLMYMVILASRDYRSVYSNQQVKNLVAGFATRTFPFDKVVSPATFDKYVQKTLIEATQSKIWYGTYAVRDPGMTVDYANKMLGVVRIRQHRSQRHSCYVPEPMSFLNLTCVADYFRSQTQEDFGEEWNEAEDPPTEGRMKNIWRFSPSNETGSSAYIGKLGIYPGGGYVAFLGRGMKNSLVNYAYLRECGWIDMMTRSIFVEFLLYNANFNIFNAVRYTIEKSSLGYLKKEVDIETSKMLLLDNESLVAIPVLLGLFIFLVLIFSVRTVIRIKRTRTWYFRDLWHFVDIILILLSLGCVWMFHRRSLEVGKLLTSLEGKDPKEFVNYFALLELDSTFTVLCAILIAVATIKLWGLFRFIIIFRVVERTFRISFIPLCALFFYNTIVILAFAFFGFLLFVDHSYRFEGYFNTVEFLIILNLRPFEGDEIDMLIEPKLGFGYVFYVSYALAVKLFSCIYTALIIIYYAKAQEYYSNRSEIYSVWDHFKEQFLFFYNLWKLRLKSFRLGGGTDVNKSSIPVTPKADEFRYAESVTLSVEKIKAMSLVSLCVIRNFDPKRKPLTQKDIRIMTYALFYLKKIKHKSADAEEAERFFKAPLGRNKVKLIHEIILKKIEAATDILLGKSLLETMKGMNIKRDEILMEENFAQIKRMKQNLSVMFETVQKISVNIRPRRNE
ncbi:uncharacterized protein LOC123313081 isoform X2 [Coccinella septempunctata]|nr:uncharacterized protein LOC123313081 isoform X2 [Coccinella septempunctata]